MTKLEALIFTLSIQIFLRNFFGWVEYILLNNYKNLSQILFKYNKNSENENIIVISNNDFIP
mgnify:CR=1 FL=1